LNALKVSINNSVATLLTTSTVVSINRCLGDVLLNVDSRDEIRKI